MLDAVMHVNVRQVKAPGLVRTVEDFGHVAGHEKAEGRREIVGCPELCRNPAERDIASIAGDDTWRQEKHNESDSEWRKRQRGNGKGMTYFIHRGWRNKK